MPLAITFLLSIPTYSQEFEEYLYEGFENNGSRPTGWTEQAVEGSFSWEFKNGGGFQSQTPDFRYPQNAYKGSYNAYYQVSQSTPTVRRLVSPPIDLSNSIKPTLTFWHAQAPWGSRQDEMKVLYRTSSSSEWVEIEHYQYAVSEWEYREIILNDDAKSTTTQIAFEAITKWGFGVCIDEVFVVERGYLDRKVESFKVKQYNNIFPSGSEINPFAYINLTVSGNIGSIPINSISIEYTGSDINDIVDVNLFHTRDSIFRVINPIVNSTTITGNTITIEAPTFNLNTGENFIWFSFDIGENADYGNTVDFTISPSSCSLGNEFFPKEALNPSGTATIYNTIFYDDFEGDENWPTSSIWEIGSPLGESEGGGISDPTYAFSGYNVLGTKLEENYPQNIGQEMTTYVLSGQATRYYKNVNILYRRWLNVHYTDKVEVGISTNSEQTWSGIFSNSFNIRDKHWVLTRHNLASSASRKDNLAIRFSIGPTNDWIEYGGWNIDNFSIIGEYIHTDVGVKNIVTPIQKCGLSNSEEVSVVLKNFGGETVTQSFDVGFSTDGGATYTKELFNLPEGIESEEEIIFTFTTGADLSTPGLKNLRFKTFLSNDQDLNNDTYITKLYVFPTENFPYSTSFESSASHWYASGVNSTWQWGVPAGANINTASNGTRVWVTSLSQQYKNKELSYLESPCFDLSDAEMPIISFDYKMYIDEGKDGLAMEYSVDGGITWQLLNPHPDYAINWYNSTIDTLGTEGWSVNQPEYITAKTRLPDEAIGLNAIKLRFVFASNFDKTYEGVAIDMIRLYERPWDVGITNLISPTNACEIGNNVNLELELTNFGDRTLKAGLIIPIAIEVDGQEVRTEEVTITSDVVKNGTFTFSTSNTFDIFIAGEHTISAYTILPDDENETNNELNTTVEVLGMPEFTLGPDIGTETPGNITLNAGTGYSLYAWYKLNASEEWELISGEVTSEYTLAIDGWGEYKAYVENSNGCNAEATIKVIESDSDVGVSSIILTDACSDPTSIKPKATIKTFASSTWDGVKSIPIIISIDGVDVIEEEFTPYAGWGQGAEPTEYVYEFTGTINLSEAREYTIRIFTNLDDDTSRSNDFTEINFTAKLDILTRTNSEPEVFESFEQVISTQADTIQLKANSGFSNYQWYSKGIFDADYNETPIGSTQTLDLAELGSTYYKVTADAAYGCGTVEEEILVNAFDLSLSNITSPSSEICFSEESTPLSVLIKNVGRDIYPSNSQIQFTAITPTGNQTQSYTLTSPLNPGGELIYEFTSSYDFPLGSTYLSFSIHTNIDPNEENNEVGVEVNTLPSPSVTINPEVLYKIFDPNETFTIEPIYSDFVDEDDYHIYSWNDGSEDSSYFILGAPEYNIYEVTVTNSFGCSASDAIRIVTSDLNISSIIYPRTNCELSGESPVTFMLHNNGNTEYTAGTNLDVDIYLNGSYIETETISLTENLASKTSSEITLNKVLDLSGMSSATVQLNISSSIEEVDNENNSRNKSVYALGYPSPNLGIDRDIYGWSEELDPGYYDTYLWHDDTSDRIYNAEETGIYSVTVTDFSGCPGSAEVVLTFYKDDIELLEVLEPETGCGLTENETISFRIQNNGNYPIPTGRTIDVGYTVNGLGFPNSITLAEDIGVGEIFEIILPQTIDLSQPKEHTIVFWIDMENDGFNDNNNIIQIINSYPALNLNLNYANGTVSNVPLVLDAGEGYSSYTWTFNGIEVSSEQTYTASISGTYGALVSNSNGCLAYKEVDITILMPDYTISELISPTNTCVFGNSHEVTVEVTNVGTDVLGAGEEIDIELWLNGTLITTETFEMASNLEPGQSIEITLDHKLNLTSATEHNIGTKVIAPIDRNPSNDMLTETVIAYGNPQVNLGGDRAINTGSVILDAGAGYQSYEWQDGSTNQTFTVTETGTYSVTVVDGNGCIGSDAVTITILIPDFSITGIVAPATGCGLSSTETITLEITNEGTDILRVGDKVPVTFEVDNQVVATEEHTVTQRIEPSNKGQFTLSTKVDLSQVKTYGLKATISHPLDNNTSNNSYSTSVEHYPSPTIDLGGDQEVTLPYTIESGVSDVDYLWSTGATTPSITVDNPGEYWLTVTNSYGCEASDTITLTISSVQVIPGTNTVVTVFPNPADQWITVRVEPRSPAKFVIELISPSGQRVYSHSLEQNQQFDHRIDVNSFASGVYILRVSSGGKWITVRLVIQR